MSVPAERRMPVAIVIGKAIAGVSEALRRLLADAAPQSGLSGLSFKVDQAANLQAPMSEGVSLFLYRINANTTRHNAAAPIRPDGSRSRSPLWLDLHYLVIAWAQDPLKQQMLLGWAAQVIYERLSLPADLLNQREPNVFDPDESVEVRLEPLSLQDETNIWQLARASQQPSLGYVASLMKR